MFSGSAYLFDGVDFLDFVVELELLRDGEVIRLPLVLRRLAVRRELLVDSVLLRELLSAEELVDALVGDLGLVRRRVRDNALDGALLMR